MSGDERRLVIVKSPMLKASWELEILASTRVRDLQRIVRDKFGGNRHVVLLYGSRELVEGDKTVGELNIVNGSVINVLAKLRAGPLGNLTANASSITSTNTRSSGASLDIMASSTAHSSRFRPFKASHASSSASQHPRGGNAPVSAEQKRMKERLEAVAAKVRAQAATKRPVVAKSFSEAELAEVKAAEEEDEGEETPAAVSKPAVKKRSAKAASAPRELRGKAKRLAERSEMSSTESTASSKETGGHHCCARCDKLLSALQRFECRCGLLFCAKHRLPEKHSCTAPLPKTLGGAAVTRTKSQSPI